MRRLPVRQPTNRQRDSHVLNSSSITECDAKYVLSIDQSDACDRKYDIAIWSMETDPPKLEFKYVAKQYENWEVKSWEEDMHIKMKAFINGKTPYDQEAELVRERSGWALHLGRKTERPR